MSRAPVDGKYSLCIVGVGNTLAGDDGAGNRAVELLQSRYAGRDDILMHDLRTDPLELWEILPLGRSFIFLDAIAGEPPGRLVFAGRESAMRAYPASLHHMDLPTVIRHLCRLGDLDEVEWSIWGVTIDVPDELHDGLSPVVAGAVDELVEVLARRIDSGDFSVEAPEGFERLDGNVTEPCPE